MVHIHNKTPFLPAQPLVIRQFAAAAGPHVAIHCTMITQGSGHWQLQLWAWQSSQPSSARLYLTLTCMGAGGWGWGGVLWCW